MKDKNTEKLLVEHYFYWHELGGVVEVKDIGKQGKV